MPLSAGAKLGPYEIIAPIGAGGMGEVYKARDPRLDRTVALKVSKAEFTERFTREARTVAQLNHPNICTLHDVGPNYLVMELVEGTALKGPLPVETAVEYAGQILEALDAAHRKGITHRDLKPANILVTKLAGGKTSIKLLDFGLAKQAPDAKPDDLTIASITMAGQITGTLQYMSPEQLQGKEADTRSDIFAFGCVLYEMLSGAKAFSGSSAASVIAAILERQPEPLKTTPPLDRVIRTCLAKDPDARFQNARDLKTALLWAMETVTIAGSAGVPSKPSRAWLPWVVVAPFALAAAALAFVHFRENAPEAPLTRLSITPPEKNGFPDASGTPAAVSPDGRQIVFEAVSSEGKSRLWLRPLDSLTAQPLAGTENALLPFWSPDGKWIGFFSSNKLKKVGLSGSPPTALADAPNPRGGTWSPDGVIVFAPTPFSLAAVSQSGGAVRILSPPDAKTGRRFPRFLPDARHFLYLVDATGGEYIIAIGSLDSSKNDRILPGAVDSFAEYAQGQLLFTRGNTLLARPFDSKKLAFTGDAIPVVEQVEVDGPFTGLARFSVSGNGVLVYRTALGNSRLTWLDRTGKRLGTLGDAGIFFGRPQFSPDRKTVAVAAREVSGGNLDIWLYDVSRGLRTRFTFDPADDLEPVWSPDGRTIVFRSSRGGAGNLFRKQADGSGTEELLYADDHIKLPYSFSPDGKYLAFERQDLKTGLDILILPDPLAKPGTSKPYPLVRTEFNEGDPTFSPNGLWMAYTSNESGRDEVYVAPFPGPGGKRQVSTAGGSAPLWRPDGNELFYYAAENRLMAAEVDAKGGAFEVKKVDALFGPLIGNGLDVSADGQRFLSAVAPEGESGEPLTVVLNWTAGLKK